MHTDFKEILRQLWIAKFCTMKTKSHVTWFKRKNLWMNPVRNKKKKETCRHCWWWTDLWLPNWRKPRVAPVKLKNHNHWRKALHVKKKKITLSPQCCCNLWMALLRHNSLMATSQPPLPTWRYSSPTEHHLCSAIQKHTVQNLLKLSKKWTH